jgi:hypothetical protein
MDSKLFVLPTEPNYYSNTPGPRVAKAAAITGAFPEGQYYVGPAPDSRFSGWAAPLEDGRLVTDYRAHCERNIPAGKQFATHQWIQRNADEIIELSRQRQSEAAGANRGFDNTIVPAAENIVTCDTFACGYSQTMIQGGIGTERREPVPELFGTFNTDVTQRTQPLPPITRMFEGGRNSLRGRTFEPLGTGPVGKTNVKATYLRAA